MAWSPTVRHMVGRLPLTVKAWVPSVTTPALKRGSEQLASTLLRAAETIAACLAASGMRTHAVTGTIPAHLDGRYLRTGPNPIAEVDPET